MIKVARSKVFFGVFLELWEFLPVFTFNSQFTVVFEFYGDLP